MIVTQRGVPEKSTTLRDDRGGIAQGDEISFCAYKQVAIRLYCPSSAVHEAEQSCCYCCCCLHISHRRGTFRGLKSWGVKQLGEVKLKVHPRNYEFHLRT